MIKKKDLYDMATKSLFLNERLNEDITFLNQDTQIIDKNYELWEKKVGGNGGKAAFEKRLEVDNISYDKAKKILSEVKCNENTPLPNWINDIEEISKTFPATLQEIKSKIYFDPSIENIKSYTIDTLLPFIYYGKKKLLEKLGEQYEVLEATAISNMSSLLLTRLNEICSKTLDYEFQNYIQEKSSINKYIYSVLGEKEKIKYWNEFREDLFLNGWKDILVKYPVLSRLIVLTIDYWIDSFIEMTNYLMKDIEKLEEVFNKNKPLGKVEKVKTALSDSHNEGRSVYILEFASGTKIVFKPRSLEIDKIWSKLLVWMKEKNYPIDLKTPKVITFDSYGWIEYIDRISLEDKEESDMFFYRSGAIFAIVYILGGKDFHTENIIAWRNVPVLIDTETLLAHRVAPFNIDGNGMNAMQRAQDIVNDSVLSIGFLPFWMKGSDGKFIDLGGITSNREDDKNTPVLNGQSFEAVDYTEKILQGFDLTYDFIVKHKDLLLSKDSPLNQLKSCIFRFVIRPTKSYANMLRHVMKPKFLKNGLHYSFEIERFALAFLLNATDENLKELWNIFLSERDALERRDIPVFYGKAEDLALLDRNKVLYTKYFSDTAFDRVTQKIKGMNKKDKKLQMEYISFSILMKYKDIHSDHRLSYFNQRIDPTNDEKIEDSILIKQSEAIYEYMMKKRIVGESNDFTWLAIQYDIQAQKPIIAPLGIDLYNGVIGIGVFMSALYNLTRKESIKNNILLMLRNFRERLYDDYNPLPIHRSKLGIGNGLGGLIRGLFAIGHYLEEESIKNDALYIAQRIYPYQIKNDSDLDVLKGTSGLLIALMDIYNYFEDEKVLELAQICGNHLLTKRVRFKVESEYRIWKTAKNHLTGFGHGVSGIANALYKLYNVTKEKKLYEAVVEAIAFEDNLYDNQYKNWHALMNGTRHNEKVKRESMTGWCSGAPGIGLSRLTIDNCEDMANVKKDIENALMFTLNYPMESSDHICCGNSGRIDFLIEASLKLNRPKLWDEAKKRIWCMIKRKGELGQYAFNGCEYKEIINPSFFQGLSGIGYEIIRCINPHKYFSILY